VTRIGVSMGTTRRGQREPQGIREHLPARQCRGARRILDVPRNKIPVVFASRERIGSVLVTGSRAGRKFTMAVICGMRGSGADGDGAARQGPPCRKSLVCPTGCRSLSKSRLWTVDLEPAGFQGSIGVVA